MLFLGKKFRGKIKIKYRGEKNVKNQGEKWGKNRELGWVSFAFCPCFLKRNGKIRKKPKNPFEIGLWGFSVLKLIQIE